MRTEEAVAAMPCSICRTGLVLSDRQGLEFDYCPTCRGVWLDRGELDMIIALNTEDASSAARTTGSRESREPRHYDDDDDHRGYGTSCPTISTEGGPYAPRARRTSS